MELICRVAGGSFWCSCPNGLTEAVSDITRFLATLAPGAVVRVTATEPGREDFVAIPGKGRDGL